MSAATQLKAILRGEVRENESLSRHTSLRVGGPADLFVLPADLDDMRAAVTFLDAAGIPRMIIGSGYNLLVRDRGIRGAVISPAKLNGISVAEPGIVRAEAGAENLSLVRFAQDKGLGGISFLAGIPGTIGGAICMNAGAYGQGILERAVSVTLLRGGEVVEFPASKLDFGYRRLILQRGDVVIGAAFRLDVRSRDEVEDEIRKDVELRRSKHAVRFPSAGSFFKNPEGNASWRLIDEAGLRGTSVGGACVSDVHTNFLVNTGGATAADFLQLAALVKKRVQENSGVLLEEEVRIVGED